MYYYVQLHYIELKYNYNIVKIKKCCTKYNFQNLYRSFLEIYIGAIHIVNCQYVFSSENESTVVFQLWLFALNSISKGFQTVHVIFLLFNIFKYGIPEAFGVNIIGSITVILYK